MDKSDEKLCSLQALIGRSVSWRNGRGVVVEILEDGPSLVVEAEERMIQADSLGYARRKTHEIWVIQVFSAEGDYTSEFLEIARD